jgi:hypothetical protein
MKGRAVLGIGLTSERGVSLLKKPVGFFSSSKFDNLSEIGGDCAGWGTPSPVSGGGAGLRDFQLRSVFPEKIFRQDPDQK